MPVFGPFVEQSLSQHDMTGLCILVFSGLTHGSPRYDAKIDSHRDIEI